MNSGRVPALELCNVCKTFGGLKATDNISIEVKEHEIYGIIGPNGAGKTTLFNLITGVVPLSSGQIKVFGQDISNLRADKICKVGVARTFQNIRLFNSATIMENLMIACQQTIQYSAIQGCLRTKQFRKEEHGAQERCRNILEKFGLLEYKDFTKPSNIVSAYYCTASTANCQGGKFSLSPGRLGEFLLRDGTGPQAVSAQPKPTGTARRDKPMQYFRIYKYRFSF